MNNDTFIRELQKAEKSINNYAIQLTNNKEEARELIQETVVRAFCRREYFADDSNFTAWMLTIMHNIYLNSLRRKNRYTLGTVEIVEYDRCTTAAHEDVYSSIDVHEAIGAVRRLAKSLNQPLLLCIRGYNYKEIAERLNISTGMVRNRIHTARVILRKMLEEEGR